MRNSGEKRNNRKRRIYRIATALLSGILLLGTAVPGLAGQGEADKAVTGQIATDREAADPSGFSQAERDARTGPAFQKTDSDEGFFQETISQTADPQDPGPAVIDGVIQPQNLEAARETDQMIVTVGTGGCSAQAFYYKKGESGWELAWQEDAIVGKNGITSEKAEGDKSTPSGTYGLTMAFGLKEDPGSLLPYHTVIQGDYWVDDPDSPYYNQLVNSSQTPKNWDSAEDMAAASPYYNYGLALDYNEDCVPGKGSAIFLHCFTASPDSGSAGCIRLPEERMRELVQSVTEQTKIVIAKDLSQLK